MAEPGRQLVQFSFAAGIDEAARLELVDPTAGFVVLENIRQAQRGAATKRRGYVFRSSTRLDGSVRTAGRRLFGRGREACAIDGHTLDSWNPTFGCNTNVDRVPELAVERFAVAGIPTLTNIALLDSAMGIAYANGLYWILFPTGLGGGLFRLDVIVYDATSRAVVTQHFNVAAGHPVNGTLSGTAEAHICAFGNTVAVAWCEDASSNINAVTFDATSAATVLAAPSAPVVLDTHLFAGHGWDIAGLETSFVLAYSRVGTGIVVARYNAALAVVTTGTPVVAGSNSLHVAVDGSEGDFIWIAWTNTADNKCYVTGIDPANTANVLSTTAAVIATAAVTATPRSRPGVRRTSATGGYAIARGDMTGASFGGWLNTASTEFRNVAGVCTAIGTPNVLWGWTPHTQPFALGGRVYALAVLSAEAAMPRNMVAFDITEYTGFLRPCASPAPAQHYYNRTNNLAAKHIVQRSATKIAALTVTQSNAVDAAIEVIEIDCTATHRWQPVEHNGVTYLSGGVMYGYDGRQLFEANFVAPPAIRVSDAGVGAIAAGTYNYTAIVEWTDAEGNVHWSEPAPPQTITLAAGHNVNVDILGYGSTWRDNALSGTGSVVVSLSGRIKVFRTKNGGGSYFLISTIPLVRDASRTTISDANTDANIAANAQLYSVLGIPGAALVRRAPPASVDAAQYNGQIAIIAEDRQTIWMSAARVVGEGLWFNPVWQTPTDDDDLVAIRAQDGTFFVWSRSSIFAVVGDPPSDNGSIGGLGTPRRLAATVGCIDSRSIVATEMGIFFQSDRGLELLTRAQSVEWVGEAVRATLAAFPIVTSAKLDARRGLVYFECVASEVDGVATGSGVALVYDISRRVWTSVDKRTDQNGTPSTPAQSSDVVWNGSAYVYAWMGADGVVHVEQEASYLDDGHFVAKRARTAPVKLSGIQGQQIANRALLLAKRATHHDHSAKFAYDYSSTFKAARVWTATELAALLANIPNEQLELDADDDAKGEAVQLEIADATPSSGEDPTTGEGATWIGLTFEVVPLEGAMQLPDGAR